MRMNRRVILIALPVMAVFIAFHVFPVVMAAYYSMVDNPFDKIYAGLMHYKEVLKNEYFLLAVKNTVNFTVPAVVVSWTVAVGIASVLWRLGGMQSAILSVLLVPMVVPSNAVTQIWNVIFQSKGSEFWAVITIFAWKNMGFAVLLLLSGLRSIPVSCIEAARLDGAGEGRIVFRIALPMIRQQAFFVGVLMMVYSLRVFKESYLLYGSYPPDGMYFLQTYINNHFNKLNYGNMTVASVMMLPVIALLALVWLRSERRRGEATK